MSHALPHDSPPPGAPRRVVLEERRRLSSSLLWDLQREYFRRAGVKAWSTDTVPHYVTNNAVLAHAYAEVLFGFFRDCRAAGGGVTEPVTLVELGAGSGRFAYLLLRALTGLLSTSPLRDTRFRYVMTDLAEANVAFWRGHPALQPFIEKGIVDFALLDVERDTSIHLQLAGETLSPDRPVRHLGVVANYVFDGVVHDAFSRGDRGLAETALTLSCDEPADVTDPAILSRLQIEHSRIPCSDTPYGDPDLDATLADAVEAAGAGEVLFPIGALRCLARLSDLGGGDVFVLSADRGVTHRRDVADAKTASIAFHGSFSLNVNYHAIGLHVLRKGGRVLAPAHRQPHLTVSGFLLGRRAAASAETEHAFARAITTAGADTQFSLQYGIEPCYADLDLDQVLSLIRLYLWDPRVVRDCIEVLWARWEKAPPWQRREVVAAVVRAWDNYYYIGEEHDLCYELGHLVQAYDAPREALELFRWSVRFHGERPKTQSRMAVCHFALGDQEAAKACFQRSRLLAARAASAAAPPPDPPP